MRAPPRGSQPAPRGEAVGDLCGRVQIAYQSGQFELAETLATRQLATDASSSPARFIRALVFARTGRRDRAIDELTQLVGADPTAFEAYLALASLLFASGRLDEGRATADAAIQLQPDDPDAHHQLGQHLLRASDYVGAAALFKQAVRLAPTRLPYVRDLATALASAGFVSEAGQVWEEFLAVQPKSTEGWVAFGRICLANNDPGRALSAGLSATILNTNSADAHILCGLAASELGDSHSAERHFLIAKGFAPENPLVLAALGLALNEQGRFSEATPHLQRSLELWPTNGLAYYTLVRANAVPDRANFRATIRQHLSDRRSSPLDRSYMEYALAKADEDDREFGLAMEHYDRATAEAYDFWLKARPWDRERYSWTIDRTIDVFNRELIERLASAGNSSERPLFVVGMIRSGTTLVEQILSSHCHIKAGGEMTYWHEHAAKVFDPATGTIDAYQLQRVATNYLAHLQSLDSSAERVTDKLPHNFAMLGLVASALPNARFINVVRHPVDNCLSVYTTAYQRPPAFTLRRDNIVLAYKEYRRLMAHWRATLPTTQLLEVSYEDLVANREAVTRRLIEFSGLDWDDACLNHEDNKRSVHTPSAWQVRQPIYTTSMGRWRNFEPWLREFAELL